MLKYILKSLLCAGLLVPSHSYAQDLTPDSRLSHIKLNLQFDNTLNEQLANEFNFALNEKVEIDPATLPKSVDLRPRCPSVYNQGELGSCTANAIAGALEFVQMKLEYKDHFTPSRLQIYYDERAKMGTIDEDSGSSLAIGIGVIRKNGAGHESLWTYEDKGDKFKQKPSEACYEDAKKYIDLDSKSVAHLYHDLTTLKAVLAQDTPIVFGVRVYESFMSKQVHETGDIPMPKTAHEKMIGGHAIMLAGYDDDKQRFIFRNSWGDSWGQAGYGTLPYDYVLSSQLASDFWRITQIGPKQQVQAGYLSSCTLF